MDPKLIWEILEILLSIGQSLTSGSAQRDVGIAFGLEQIAKKAAEGFKQQTGQPMDPSLLIPEDKV